ARATQAFHTAHQRLYSHCDPHSAVQIVNLRVSAIGRTDHVPVPKITRGTADARRAQKGERQVHFQESGRYLVARIYDRERLAANNRIRGPAMIEQADSTIVVPPSCEIEIDAHGRLLMRRASPRASRHRR